MVEPKKPVFKDYTVGFRVTSEQLEDSDWGELTALLDQQRADCASYLANELYQDIAGRPMTKPISKFRRWLGWVLWRLAVKLNPEVIY